ncbi:gamma-glutamyl-gamma-aminobutyrate hydrolase family protein [Acidisoma silvae]|uniref:gamma-glutamyl-gamma-aminobutyrate hydrolase n=1 Tax=Acidisoma silvae TaxID=2802396 RepID=A0A963YTM1_9PROT|nr:gamma-glutamyl-gamma-aminobutyrate hydrolase family protein [Acidisoma silvae]MCB8876716.1 gamma-glutamyl-gamma-aminobutyrate hydrolase family protein [Acidisoma silvae]
MKPLIGISCCQKSFGRFAMLNHAVSDTYVRAVGELIGGVPILIPANGSQADIDCLVERLDGIILTGSPSNVEPALYGGDPHPPETPEDHCRDAVTLPLIRATIELGMPLLGICRGFQEMNVALGGTLHQRLQDLPGRIDHSTPMQSLALVRHAKAHAIRVVSGSWLHRVAQARDIAVNSLHNQGVDRLAPGLVAEGHAPDGTIEAFRVAQASGFAVGVQWHPEYDMDQDAVSRRIFLSFADAVAAYRTGGQRLSTVGD